MHRNHINAAIVKRALLEHTILKITRVHTGEKKNILNAGIVKRALLWQLILHNMIEDTLGNQN